MALYLINYRHASSAPAQSITRLPLEEASKLASQLYHSSTCKAHRRFGPDFVQYYENRKKAEQWLYQHFQLLGGHPKTTNPLYFSLQTSSALASNYNDTQEIRLDLDTIADEDISFTLGDSMALYYTGSLNQLLTKQEILALLASHDIDAFIRASGKHCTFIEAQLWNDEYIDKEVIFG